MSLLILRRYALPSCVAFLLLAGCGGSQPPIGAPGAMPQSRASDGYKTLYSFGSYPDAQEPKAALLNLNGTLYGTTYLGGKHKLGAVFTVSTAGVEKVLYDFNYPGGENPAAALIAVNGVLYGTTENGGQARAGTAFSITPGGNQHMLYNFGSIPDGANPVASLIYVKGKFYGTTSNGGTDSQCSTGCGTVFRLSTSGKEKVLHSFTLYSDGATPTANLTNMNGILYGTTEAGGAVSEAYNAKGTIFKVSLKGTENVIYNFLSNYSSDGGVPEAGLIKVGTSLYGTTSFFGKYSGGTAYSITKSGRLGFLHSFGSGLDGSASYAPLLDVKGTLYGTTTAGGAYGKGTIFRLTRGGKEKVLHSFGYGSDGAAPLAGLINVNGTLYGTTSAGGTYDNGTVFALTLPSGN